MSKTGAPGLHSWDQRRATLKSKVDEPGHLSLCVHLLLLPDWLENNMDFISLSSCLHSSFKQKQEFFLTGDETKPASSQVSYFFPPWNFSLYWELTWMDFWCSLGGLGKPISRGRRKERLCVATGQGWDLRPRLGSQPSGRLHWPWWVHLQPLHFTSVKEEDHTPLLVLLPPSLGAEIISCCAYIL